MTRLVFKIQGMDCPEEVAVLRRAIGPVVGGEERLSCDLLNGTMTVSLPEATAHPGPIVQAVRKTGMHASLCQEHGLLALISSGTSGTAMLPFASWLLYLGAMVSGAWYVVPKALYALRTVRPDMHVLMLVAVAGPWPSVTGARPPRSPFSLPWHC